MSGISKYVDWMLIWAVEVVANVSLKSLTESGQYETWKSCMNDKEVKLDKGQCKIHGKDLMFVFSETERQNESDTQGWHRRYWFLVDPEEDFKVIDSGYKQI